MITKLRKIFSTIQRRIDTCRGVIYADLFVSVGEACRPAHYLQKYHLRSFSSPFDWCMCYKLEHIIHFLQNDGADFFAKFQEIRQDSQDYSHRFVQDSQTGMVSMHDFVRDKTVAEYYPEFIAKYKRRFANLKSALLKSKCVVFVGNRDDEMDEFQRFLSQMQTIHNAEYIFVNIRHKQRKIGYKRKIIDFNVGGGGGNHIIEYSFNDTHPKGENRDLNPDFWLGNPKIWKKIMKKFKLQNQTL